MRVKIALFDDDRPSEMNEFTRDGTAGDFLGLTGIDKPAVEGFENRIKAGSRSGSHVQDVTQLSMTRATDATLAAFGRAGVAGMGSEAREGSGLFGGITAGKAMGGNQQPGGGDGTNTGDGEQALGGLGPIMVAVE